VITRATITGAPAAFEQMPKANAEPARGHAKTIDYEIGTGNVSLRDGAWLAIGCQEIRAEELVYNIRAQRVLGDGRPRFTVQPGGTSSTGVPCGKPASTP
jgi:lipopolysaccharide transport protein LptA